MNVTISRKQLGPKLPINKPISSATPRSSQSGLTLIELLVALAISTVIAIAAVSALIVSRQGFTAVDASSQLRDNARFANDLIQRLGVQSGYQDISIIARAKGNDATLATNPPPNVYGANNSIPSATAPDNTFLARPVGASLAGSDVLVLRYQASETFPGSGVSDSTMIDCAGNPSTAVPVDANDRILSVLHVDVDQTGEPSLMCTTINPATGNFFTQPVIRGVENFQVLYGADSVVPNTAPTTAPGFSPVPTSYLRADQMTVAGDLAGTNANWARVRSIRIGMVFRGALNSAQESTAMTYFPLGQAKASSGGTAGSALASANDPGTAFQPAADSRLRQVATFTVHLRNNQTL
jgi:type IV pilus assembly protein PilW